MPYSLPIVDESDYKVDVDATVETVLTKDFVLWIFRMFHVCQGMTLLASILGRCTLPYTVIT